MSKACELCRGACCESMMMTIDNNPVTTEFYRARASVFTIDSLPAIEIDSRCPSLSASGKCKCYASRPVACIRFAVGSTMCLTAIERRRPDQAEAIKALI
jgi:Fe-S-cluster containining protein